MHTIQIGKSAIIDLLDSFAGQRYRPDVLRAKGYERVSRYPINGFEAKFHAVASVTSAIHLKTLRVALIGEEGGKGAGLRVVGEDAFDGGTGGGCQGDEE